MKPRELYFQGGLFADFIWLPEADDDISLPAVRDRDLLIFVMERGDIPALKISLKFSFVFRGRWLRYVF